jgi:hypothetical protein
MILKPRRFPTPDFILFPRLRSADAAKLELKNRLLSDLLRTHKHEFHSAI